MTQGDLFEVKGDTLNARCGDAATVNNAMVLSGRDKAYSSADLIAFIWSMRGIKWNARRIRKAAQDSGGAILSAPGLPFRLTRYSDLDTVNRYVNANRSQGRAMIRKSIQQANYYHRGEQ